jgi:hypothetical protein
VPSPELREPPERQGLLQPGNVRPPRYTSRQPAANHRRPSGQPGDAKDFMSTESFDAAAAHRHFAPVCFNRAWELIEKTDRISTENDEMLLAAMASLWHWSQREDCQPRNLAVGYWQVSRVQSALGNGIEARRFAARSAMHAANEPPFFMAYAHEALARAGRALKDETAVQRHLVEAKRLLADVTDPHERELLETDLATLQQPEG